MCGIIGMGDQQAADIVLASLQRLGYRGYDSAGRLYCCRWPVKSYSLSWEIEQQLALADRPETARTDRHRSYPLGNHGGVTEQNAHPHTAGGRVAIVHNGIIENYAF